MPPTPARCGWCWPRSAAPTRPSSSRLRAHLGGAQPAHRRGRGGSRRRDRHPDPRPGADTAEAGDPDGVTALGLTSLRRCRSCGAERCAACWPPAAPPARGWVTGSCAWRWPLPSGRPRAGQRLAVGRPAGAGAPRQRAQRIKDDFLSIVSHELRTPLTSIRGYPAAGGADARLGQRQGAVADAGHPFAGDAHARLVDDLLDVAASTGAAASASSRSRWTWPGDPRGGGTHAARHPNRTITVEAPEPLPIVADRDRIGQVLTNLLDNAIKYSPDGGEVTVRAGATGSDVDVAVLDEGGRHQPGPGRRGLRALLPGR